MQIVIDISEEDYEYCKDRVKRVGDRLLSMVEGRVDTIVANGTPLPKEHGRLIDADELEIDIGYEGYLAEQIENAPAIIEADKAESEVSDANSD